MEGGKEMSQVLQNQLVGIMQKLAADCQSAIAPRQVKFTQTPGQSEYHFLVPNPSRKQLIAWGNYRTRRSSKYGKNQPCAIVAADACLLNYKDPVYIKYYIPKAQWSQPNRGEVHIAVCQIGDSDYALALRVLTEAARNLLFGIRYPW
jgi:hypothetical protein